MKSILNELLSEHNAIKRDGYDDDLEELVLLERQWGSTVMNNIDALDKARREYEASRSSLDQLRHDIAARKNELLEIIMREQINRWPYQQPLIMSYLLGSEDLMYQLEIVTEIVCDLHMHTIPVYEMYMNNIRFNEESRMFRTDADTNRYVLPGYVCDDRKIHTDDIVRLQPLERDLRKSDNILQEHCCDRMRKEIQDHFGCFYYFDGKYGIRSENRTGPAYNINICPWCGRKL